MIIFLQQVGLKKVSKTNFFNCKQRNPPHSVLFAKNVFFSLSRCLVMLKMYSVASTKAPIFFHRLKIHQMPCCNHRKDTKMYCTCFVFAF